MCITCIAKELRKKCDDPDAPMNVQEWAKSWLLNWYKREPTPEECEAFIRGYCAFGAIDQLQDMTAFMNVQSTN